MTGTAPRLATPNAGDGNTVSENGQRGIAIGCIGRLGRFLRPARRIPRVLGMAWGAGWVGVLFGFAIQLSRGLSLTLFYDALNRRVPGDFRATVNSLVSLGVRGVFIVSAPEPQPAH